MVGVGVRWRGWGWGAGEGVGGMGGGAEKGYVTVQHPVERLVEVHLATLRHVRSEGVELMQTPIIRLNRCQCALIACELVWPSGKALGW